MQIPEEKIQEVLLAADIVDVVSKYVPLKRSGGTYKGLCPFHQEKTPSFTVTPKKQIFHCFGCHKGGNAIKFLMEYNNIPFLEAVRVLANEYGIDLPSPNPKDNELQKRFEVLYDLTKATIGFFAEQLTANPDNKHILEYLKNRELNETSIKNFRLGYAPGVKGKLVEFYKQRGFDLRLAIELGFLGESEGRVYERFAGRVIFPIFSHHGREIGAGGRIIEKRTDVGKYINSPESPIYNKSKVLYGLSHSKDEIRKLDHVIIVEGYLDVISLFQNGVKNIVAVSGTALTDEQVKLLSSFTKNFYLLFDADAAGYKAAMRSIEVVMKQNLNLKIMSLPEGEDPDSFVRKFGGKQFRDRVANALEFIDYQYLSFKNTGIFGDPEKTTAAIKEMVRPVALIPDEIRKSMLLKSIAEKFKIREHLLEEEAEKVKREEIEYRPAVGGSSPAISGAMPDPWSTTKVVQRGVQVPRAARKSATELNEIELIKLMFEGNEDVVRFIFQFIRPEEYTVPLHYVIAEKVYEEIESGIIPTVMSISSSFSPEEVAYINELVVEKYKISEPLDDLLPVDLKRSISTHTIDSVKKFRLLRLEAALKDVQKEIAMNPGHERAVELAGELNSIIEEKRDIERIMGELKKNLG